ncbi:MAG: type II secretion system F family protein [Vulcanimicrobiota bacterium]
MVTSEEVAVLTRQLSTLLSAGVHVSHALEVIANGAEREEVHDLVVDLGRFVSQGNYLSNALRKHSDVFPEVYVSLIRTGEKSSSLTVALDRLATWMERDVATRKRVKSALIYPGFILAMTGVFVFLIFHSVLPGLLKGFAESKEPLPLITQVVAWVASLTEKPVLLLLIFVGTLVSLRQLRNYFKTREGQRELFRRLHAVPVLSGLTISLAMSRYCSSMQTMLAAGLNLIQCLELSAASCGHPLVADDLLRAVADMRTQGNTLVDSLEYAEYLPSSAVHLLSAGEESGALDAMYRTLARYYDEEVSYKLDTLSSLLEPALLLLVSLIVGTVLIAVFLPLYSRLGQLG